MDAPPSPHFRPRALADVFSHERGSLDAALRPPAGGELYGERALRGIPFAFGPREGPNVLLLEGSPVAIELGGARASYLVLVHAVEDRAPGDPDWARDGRRLGDEVAEYRLEHAGGERTVRPLLRRFAVQQARTTWGASAFAAAPARDHVVARPAAEAHALGLVLEHPFGVGETRTVSGRDAAERADGIADLLWIYALPNPRPEEALERLVLTPRGERCAVYALTLASVAAHPLREPRRRVLRLRLPAGARRDALGEPELAADLGTVVSARPALDYDGPRWLDGSQKEAARSRDEVLVELVAHEQARLYARLEDGGLAALEAGAPRLRVAEPAERPVCVRVVEAGTGRELAARLHLHGEAGEHLPPRGHHRRVNGAWFEDWAGEHVSGPTEYAYVDGSCEVLLPLGPVWVEASRGYEHARLRRQLTIEPATEELVLELERELRWRERGWVSADTHVHFLSPATALLEGAAEGVNVVNLLAAQWGELFTNVADFDGATTFGARELGGSGEFLVRVGSENRMQVLGHLSLLGYAGSLIHPLSTGGPSESALGDALEVTMADWARRCREQGGLVVLPHAPDPQLEGAADVVLGLVDALELMTPNPFLPEAGQLSPAGLADWYRYLSLGHQLPLVGGSDKMAASMLLGGIRTYARLDDEELSYPSWMAAVRRGDTFATVGPLAELRVEGMRPGGRVALPAGGGTLAVEWLVESAALPVERVEVVAGGLTAHETTHPGGSTHAEGSVELHIERPTWVALRVRGSYRGRSDDVAAHTSAVRVDVAGREHFSSVDAGAVLDQIQGALAYLDTLAPRAELRRQLALRATLESAYNRLHQRLHRAGIYHRHSPLHDPAHAHEH